KGEPEDAQISHLPDDVVGKARVPVQLLGRRRDHVLRELPAEVANGTLLVAEVEVHRGQLGRAVSFRPQLTTRGRQPATHNHFRRDGDSRHWRVRLVTTAAISSGMATSVAMNSRGPRGYRAAARGRFPCHMYANERVPPQNGQGCPVRVRKGQGGSVAWMAWAGQ